MGVYAWSVHPQSFPVISPSADRTVWQVERLADALYLHSAMGDLPLDRWQQIDAVFAAVLERTDDDRDACLRDLSRGDAALYDEVRTLLRSASAADGDRLLSEDPAPFVDQLLRDVSQTLAHDDAALPSGGQIGPYRLIEQAGRGGMATVYLAERDAGGVRQRVALKLVKRGTDTDEVLRRFRRESKVLASLEHPHIARFYDAGASSDGRPYLVMEFVDGLPLTASCDSRRLGIDERVRLFGTVCRAVQFAHQNLIVHRDIKPSNILVSADGEPKLLDFGIAKLLADSGDDDAQTRTGVRAFTPEYAAPEQIHGGAISTATDVFALGVVLHELLTGSRPSRISGEASRGSESDAAAYEAMAPSMVVRRLGREMSSTVTTARATTPDRLRRALQGDLDRIVLKALEREPSRRYQSAQQLLDDLDRHDRGLPVLARPQTLGYRLRKYARRHRAALAAVAAAVILLAGFAGFHTQRITGERDRAQAEAAKARATTSFLQQLLGDAYPSVARGDTFSMDDLLRRAVARVDSIAGQPEVQAEVLRTLGDVYREQGRFDEASELLERSVAIHRASTGRTVALGSALSALGHLYYERQEYERSLPAHREELEIFLENVAPDDSLVLYAMNNVAASATALRLYDEALSLHREVLARRHRLFTDTSALVHVTHSNTGHLLAMRGDLEGSERQLREALRLRRLALPADHPSLGLALNNLGSTLENLGRWEEAELLHREALAIWQRVYGPEHHRIGLSASNLATVLQGMGRFAEAESLFRVTLDIDRKVYGDEHSEIGLDLRNLGRLFARKGDCAAAEQTLLQAEAIFEKNNLPLSHSRRLTTRGELGACLATLGRHAEAEELLVGNYQTLTSQGSAADTVQVRHATERLVELYRSWGRAAQADSFQLRLTAAP